MAPARKPQAKTSTGNVIEERTAEAAKTARLRALRLAKEAEDREAAVKSALATPPKPTRSRRAASSAAPRIGPAD